MRARTPRKHTKYSFPDTNETKFGRRNLDLKGENDEAVYGVTNMRYDSDAGHYIFDFYKEKTKVTSVTIPEYAIEAGSPIGFEYGTIGLANYGLYKPSHGDLKTLDDFFKNVPEIKGIKEGVKELGSEKYCEEFNTHHTQEMIDKGGTKLDGTNVWKLNDGPVGPGEGFSQYASEVSIDISIKGEDVGKVIGKGFANINQIQEDTGVRIDVGSKDKTPKGELKVINIKGTDDSVSEAILMIKEKAEIVSAKDKDGNLYDYDRKEAPEELPFDDPEVPINSDGEDLPVEPAVEPENEPEDLTEGLKTEEEKAENLTDGLAAETAPTAEDAHVEEPINEASVETLDFDTPAEQPEPVVITEMNFDDNIIDESVAEGLNESSKLSAREELDKAMYLDNYIATYGDLDRADSIPDGYEEVWRVSVETENGSRDMYFPLGDDGPSEELKDFFAPLMADGEFSRVGRTFVSDEITFTITAEAQDPEVAGEYIRMTNEAINGNEISLVNENGESSSISLQASEPFEASKESIADTAEESEAEEYVFDEM